MGLRLPTTPRVVNEGVRVQHRIVKHPFLPFALAALLFAVAGCGSSSTSGRAPDECDQEGAETGMENGTLRCTMTSDGLRWKPVQATGGEQQNGDQQEQTGKLPRVGVSCDDEGDFGFGDGMVTICDGGRYRYALPDDIPPTPAGGYVTRPDWYPTLADIFGATVDECSNGSVQFTHPIVAPEQLSRTAPAGLMIFDHVTPIDHMYIGIAALDKKIDQRTDADRTPITAPGDGTIIEIASLGDPMSSRVVISHGCGIVSIYMVVNEFSGVLAGEPQPQGTKYMNVPVKAGDEFATQTQNPMDFNIFDGSTWLPGFVNPFSYANGEPWKPYTADPFPFFTPDVRGPLEASMQRTIEPRWGKIDRDVAGTAAGNWFLDGTIGYNGFTIDAVRTATSALTHGQQGDKTTYAYGHLSLSQEPVDETCWIFSIGWWSNPNGDPRQLMIDLSAGAKAPDQLTAADGAVVYRLVEPKIVQPADTGKTDAEMSPDGIGYTIDQGQPQGWVVVQVLDDGTIAIELSTDPAVQPTGFTDARRVYHR